MVLPWPRTANAPARHRRVHASPKAAVHASPKAAVHASPKAAARAGPPSGPPERVPPITTALRTYHTGSDGLLNPHDVWNYQVRGETPTQRLDRCYAELLQEVRVAQTGVHLLLACLLTLAFTPRFAALTAFQQRLYVASLVLSAAAAAMLIAPAPFHRMLFQRRLKRQVVAAASHFMLCGLFLLLLSLGTVILLILDLVVGSQLAAWLTGAMMGWFATWWYAAPLWSRLWHARRLTRAVLPPDRCG
jgi:Family of unknown function (DUF6328)